jgi:hypothetical protein
MARSSQTSGDRKPGPITLAAVLSAVVLFALTLMNPHHSHDQSTADARHMPTIIISSEMHLWMAIAQEIERNPDRSIEAICQAIEAKDPALMLCPVSKTRLAVNPDVGMWRSLVEPGGTLTKPDAVAIVSRARLHDRGQPNFFQVLCIDSSNRRVDQLPKWAEIAP